MTEKSIHQSIISYGVLTVTLVINALEEDERYEECAQIKSGLESFNKRFYYLNYPLVTQYSAELEKEYYDAMGELTKTDCKIAKENMDYYIREVFKKLEL